MPSEKQRILYPNTWWILHQFKQFLR